MLKSYHFYDFVGGNYYSVLPGLQIVSAVWRVPYHCKQYSRIQFCVQNCSAIKHFLPPSISCIVFTETKRYILGSLIQLHSILFLHCATIIYHVRWDYLSDRMLWFHAILLLATMLPGRPTQPRLEADICRPQLQLMGTGLPWTSIPILPLTPDSLWFYGHNKPKATGKIQR